MDTTNTTQTLTHEHDPRSIPIWQQVALVLVVATALVLLHPAHAFAGTINGNTGGIKATDASNQIHSWVVEFFGAAIGAIALMEFLKRDFLKLGGVIFGGALAAWLINDPSALTSIGSSIGSFL